MFNFDINKTLSCDSSHRVILQYVPYPLTSEMVMGVLSECIL